MYKVTKRYEPVEDGGAESEYLVAEKGDIIIDGEFINGIWFYGKNARTGKSGKLHRDDVISFCHTGSTDSNGSFIFTDSDLDSIPESIMKDEESKDDPINNDNGDVDKCNGGRVAQHVSNCVNLTSDEKNDTDNADGNRAVLMFRSARENEYTILTDSGCQFGNHNYEKACDSSRPLMNDPAKVQLNNSEYALPQIIYDHCCETAGNSCENEEKPNLLSVFRSRSIRNSKKGVKCNEVKENFYNPPADVRDNYFLRTSRYPVLRLLICTIAALIVGLASLFACMMTQNIILAVSIALVLFIIVFVVPLTLPFKSCLCVLTLILPSMFSIRTKIAGMILLVVLLLTGPIIGIANKLHLATVCKNGPDSHNSEFWEQIMIGSTPRQAKKTVLDRLRTPASPIKRNCITLFKSVDKFCDKVYDDLQNDCRNHQDNMNEDDTSLCKKRKESFCKQISYFEATCSIHAPKVLRISRNVRSVLSYLVPFLILLLVSDAYIYNKNYLTIKDADNIYVTQQLRELDKERKSRDTTDLVLPLTRIEFQTYVIRGRFLLSKVEKSNLFKGICIFFLTCFLSSCFIFTERFIHMALLNSLDGPCKEIYKISTVISHRIYIYILLVILLIMTVLQSYMLRFRSIVCDYFYPIMVNIRANHLYYKIIHDRHSFGRHMRRKIQLLAEAKRLNRRISCLSMIYQSLPGCFSTLISTLCIRRCMICDSTTYWKTIECEKVECQAHYCYECYVDAEQKCLTCKIPDSPTANAARLSLPTAV